MILSNAIAFLGFIEWAALMYQIYYAYTSLGSEHFVITLSSFGIYCGLYLINVIFIIVYCIKIHFSDIAYQYWR